MALRSEQRFINIDRVESGMMLVFKYVKLSGEQDTYTVLVIDPNRTNNRAREPQLHGFIIEELSDEELIQFIVSFRTTTNIGDYENRRKAIVDKLDTDTSYEKFRSSKYADGRPYRTFNRSKISQLRQILIGEVE
jgi:hypothetical protein